MAKFMDLTNVAAVVNYRLVGVDVTNSDVTFRFGGAGGVPFNNSNSQLIGTTIVGGVTPMSNVAKLSANTFTDTQTGSYFYAKGVSADQPGAFLVRRFDNGALVGQFAAVGDGDTTAPDGSNAGDAYVYAASLSKALHLGVGLTSLAAVKITSTTITFRGTTFSFIGDLKFPTEGNGIFLKEGTDAAMGQAVLVGGTVTVATSRAHGTLTEIFLTRRVAGGTLGNLSIGTIVNSSSFVINSDNALDTSTISWFIVGIVP